MFLFTGLDKIHDLTSDGRRYELHIDMISSNGTKGYARYSNFYISDETDNYRLHVDAFVGGNAGKYNNKRIRVSRSLSVCLSVCLSVFLSFFHKS